MSQSGDGPTRMRGIDRPNLIALSLTLVALLAGALGAETALRAHARQSAAAAALHTLDERGAALTREVYQNLAALRGLASHIALDPDLDQARFETYARALMQGATAISHLAAAPDLVLRFVHPLAGNEAIVGLDYRELPNQSEAALRAVKAGAVVIAGPLDLIQGGRGFVARSAVRAIDDPAGLWGVAAAVIDPERLFAGAGLTARVDGLDIAMRGRDARGATGEVFLGVPGVFDAPDARTTIDLPHGRWILAARIMPGAGLPAPGSIASVRAVAAGLGLGALLFFVHRSRSRQEHRAVAKAALESETSFRTLFDGANDGVFINDAQTMQILDVNRQVERYLGYAREQLVGMKVGDIYCEENSPDLARMRERAVEHGSVIFEAHHRRVDGTPVPVEVSTKLVNFGERDLFISIVRDISERKRIENALKRSQQDLINAIESISEGFTLWDQDDRLRLFNERFLSITPATRHEISIGMTFEDLVRATASKGLVEAARNPEAWIVERVRQHRSADSLIELKTLNGRHIRISEHRTPDGYIVGIYTDVTEIKEAEEHIRFRAYYDALTELPNRENFMNQLASTIRMSERTKTQSALMFVDLDRFKNINDTMGHETGDLLLQEAAKRICESVRQTDTVARFGGDEFTVILRHIDDVTSAARVAENIIQKLSRGYQLGGHTFYSGASIGITVCPTDSSDPQDLLRNADMAMYQAKAKGRNTYQFFTSAMTDRAEHFVALEKDLRRSVRSEEFSLHYQPVVRLQDASVAGAEALMRWNHPQRGYVSPAEFIPVAEETRLIVDLGAWALKEACERAGTWCAPGGGLPSLAINVSSRQFYGGFDAPFVAAVLAETGFPAERLTLEMTESLLIEEDDRISATLDAFRQLGVGIAVDDFGTGYSALSYLRRFPVTTLKIDRAFVRDIETDTSDAKLVESIVAMARALSITVIAEGVETAAQADLLRDMGCAYAQGYLFSKPLPADAFESQWLAAEAPRARAV